jgi:hypothetical protein
MVRLTDQEALKRGGHSWFLREEATLYHRAKHHGWSGGRGARGEWEHSLYGGFPKKEGARQVSS